MTLERPLDSPPPDWESEREARIEEIVAGYIERLNGGEEIRPEDVLAQHPDLAGEILEHLECFLDFKPASAGDEPLRTLGDYTLRRQIGRGGMGVVYEAWERSMDRRVALKVLPAGVAADPRACARFLREAQIAGKLSHPNVVPVYFTGIKEQIPFYAMEFVEGETLAQLLARLKGAPSDVETPFGKKDDVRYFANLAEVFAAVAEGLQHAHSKGIIHRDLKPSNLILDRDVKAPSGGRSASSRPPFTLRILDFGLAHLEGQASLSATGDFLGTPLYMSPEQARRKRIEVDHRTDIYSLGATLYETLAGRPPFQGKDHDDTLSQIIGRDPRPPRQLNSRVPRDLETIVLKCLRKAPGDRYGTAEALAQDFRRFGRGDPVEARPESRLERLSRRLLRHRIAVLVAGVLAVLLVALGWQSWGKHRAELEARRAELEAREAARLLHDATVRDAAMELYSGQLTLLGQDLYHLSQGLLMFRAKKFSRGPAGIEDTLRKLERAADVVPERPDAPYYLALLYRFSGDEESARREAARALERDGDFVPAEVLAREIALDWKPLGETELEPILERFRGKPEPNWQEPWLLVYKHVRGRAWREAADAYGRLIELREPEPYVGFAVEALMGRGSVRLRVGDFHGAITDFAAARGIWSRLGEAVLGLGAAWLRAGHAEEAERIFGELHAGSPEGSKGEVAGWIAWIYHGAGDKAKAKEWYERTSGWTRVAILCTTLYWMKKYDECIEEAEKFLEAQPSDALMMNTLGWPKLARQWGRRGPRWDAERREVLELAQKACALSPNNRYLRCLLAQALQVNGRPEEALSAIDDAIRLQMRTGVESFFVFRSKGVILYLQGKLPEAEGVLKGGLEKWPEGYTGLLFELAVTHELMGRYEEAAREFRAAIDAGDGAADRFSHLAGVLNRLGRHEEAAEAAEEALRRLPKNTSGHEELARALWKLGRSEEALEVAGAGIRELPGRENLHFVIGKILEDLGKVEDAAKAYCLELRDIRLEDAESHEALRGLLRKRPDLASSGEVRAVAGAIERRKSAGSCDALLLETLSLIREQEREESGTPVNSGE